jgi:outer membrane lipoprotein SlyB
VLLGIAGALIGGLVASAIGTGDIFELNFLGTIVGIVAAAGLIGAADRAGIGKHRRRDSLKPSRRRDRDALKPS